MPNKVFAFREGSSSAKATQVIGHWLWGGANILLGDSLWKGSIKVLQVSQPTQETGRLPVKSSPASTWVNLTGALAPTGEVCLLPLGASVDNRGAWGCYTQQVPGCTLLNGNALDLIWKQWQTVDQISCFTNPIQFIGRCQSAKTKKILADCGDAQVDWLSHTAKQGR